LESLISTNRSESGGSLRQHPMLRSLFQSAEGRHFSEAELAEYREAAPAFSDRAQAARECARVQAEVVERTVDHILLHYPFEKVYSEGRAKCLRDVGNVATYAINAMLMNDSEWLRDKFLLWLRTILQAFMFPKRAAESRAQFNRPSAASEQIMQLPQRTQSLFETYTRLSGCFKDALSPASFELLKPYLQQSIDTLTAE